MRSNANIFTEKFKEIEEEIKANYNPNKIRKFMDIVKANKHLNFRYSDIEFLYSIRNILCHKASRDEKDVIEPNKYVLNLTNEIYSWVLNPKRAINICQKNVFTASLDDNVYIKMQEMKKNNYTYLPILEDNIVKGVFSESTLFGIFIDEKEYIFEQSKVKFSDIEVLNRCMLNNHVSDRFKFVSKDCYLEEIIPMFKNSYNEDKRLVLIMVTEHGRQNEKLIGVITPWDVL